MVGHGGSSASSYLADPTSPIPSHCASIVATSTVRVKDKDGLLLGNIRNSLSSSRLPIEVQYHSWGQIWIWIYRITFHCFVYKCPIDRRNWIVTPSEDITCVWHLLRILGTSKYIRNLHVVPGYQDFEDKMIWYNSYFSCGTLKSLLEIILISFGDIWSLLVQI